MGGAVNSILGGATDLVGGVLGGASDVIEGGANAIQDNPLAAAALIASGYYFAPEMGAWINSTGEAMIPGTAQGAYGAGLDAATGFGPEAAGGASSAVGGSAADLAGNQSLIDAYGGAAAAPAAAVAGGELAPAVAGGALAPAVAGGELAPVVATDVGSMGAVAPVTAETAAAGGLGAAAGAAGAGAGVDAATNALAGAGGAAAAGGLSNLLVPGAILGSSLLGAGAAKSAADTQAAATDRANQVALDILNQQKALNAPYREAGITAQNRLMDLLGLSGNTGAEGYGSANKPFTYSDLTASPDYQFRLGEGLKALDRQAAARGGLISGGALKATQDFGQQSASQEYQNAFNRYQTNRTNMLQPLGNLITSGQNAAANTGAAAGTYGQTAGNNITSGAAAQAAGNVGTTNALTGGLNQYLNYSANNNLLNVLAQQRKSAYTD